MSRPVIRALILTAALIALATPAAAGPLAGLVVTAFTAVKTALAAGGIVGFLTRTALSMGASLLSQALAKKGQTGGQVIGQITAGEAAPQALILGTYVTGGHLDYRNSHGKAGKTPNAYFTQVISLCDAPVAALRRVLVGDTWVTLDAENPHADFGLPMVEKRVGSTDYGWVKFYDGTQTEADAHLVEVYGADPDMPWTEDHIGTGVAYVIVTLRLNDTVWKNVPAIKFEMDGVPVYDPRADTSVGGDGDQRHDDPETWGFSANLIVNAYNVARGVPLPGGDVYGGDLNAAALPFDNWVAAMNIADTVLGTEPDTRPQFHGGLEIALADTEPAAVIEELLAAALTQIAESGGVFRVRTGPPADPVMTITDADWVISAPRLLDPVPGLTDTHNGLRVSHPNAAAAWEITQTDLLTDAGWEEADGNRRLTRALTLAACGNHDQARQIGQALAFDARRWATVTGHLPPEYLALQELDAVEITSTRWGWTDKVFEVVDTTFYPGTLIVAVTLRERDIADYTPPAPVTGPSAPSVTAPASRQIDTGDWSLTAGAVTDASAVDRRPALALAWDGEVIEDAATLAYEVQITATEAPVTAGVVRVDAESLTVSDGVLASTGYRVRLRPVMGVETDWSDWKSVTTSAVTLLREDLSDGAATDFLQATIEGEFNITDVGGDYSGAWVTVETLSLGATVAGDQWQIHAYVDCRSQSWANPDDPPPTLTAAGEFRVYFRVQDAVEGWSGWIETASSGNSWFDPWDHLDVQRTFGHVATDIEVRVDLRASGSDPADSSVARIDLFRNLSLSAERRQR